MLVNSELSSSGYVRASMNGDVFRDDTWLLSEYCLDADENKKRKSNLASNTEDAQTGN